MRDLGWCLAVVSTPWLSAVIVPAEAQWLASSSGVPIKILRITPSGGEPGISVVCLALLASCNCWADLWYSTAPWWALWEYSN